VDIEIEKKYLNPSRIYSMLTLNGQIKAIEKEIFSGLLPPHLFKFKRDLHE